MSVADAEQITESLQSYKYDCSSGPLWCVRLLPVENNNTLSVPSADLDEEVERFPHCYYLFLGFHHIIGDAIGFIKICGELISLLDDMIDGVDISDEGQQLGIFDTHEEFEQLLREYEDDATKEACMMELEAEKRQTSILADTLKVPEGTERKTLLLTKIWDPITSSRFFKRCKEEGVTVSSCFVALMNLALADILASRGVVQDTYSFFILAVVNLRRYWKSDDRQNLCAYNNTPTIHTKAYSSLRKSQFWNYVRSVHRSFQENLKEEKHLHFTANKKYSHRQHELAFNNIGDVTTVLARGKRNVQVTFIERSHSFHNTRCNWIHISQTLRGCFINTLQYNSAFLPDEVAAEYSDNISRYLKEMVVHTDESCSSKY